VGSAHLFLAVAAGMTSRIRLGTGCTRLPVHHPLRLAEDLAFLDQVSAGRLNWGIGKGYDPKEFTSYGFDMSERDARYEETLQIVLQAFSEGGVRHQGEYFQIPKILDEGDDEKVPLFPPTVQKPHPPVFVMVSGSDRTIIDAATKGYAFILGPVMEIEDVKTKVELYRESASKAGFDEEHIDQVLRRSSQLKPVHVADTLETAMAEFERGLMWFMTNRDNRGMFGFSKFDQPYEYYVSHRGVLLGPGDKIREDIERFRAETGLGGITCWFDCGGQPREQVERSMRGFASAMMP
jgi:alkanesulfonate monooxygenase SsuD/methylene tetrahydromethanopterin reductase-like flavin-dependent oxidoreductase (luciferase family)